MPIRDARSMTSPLKTRILLADDHAIVRKGLRMVLDAEPDLEVVAEAGDGAEARRARRWPSDIHLAILDVSMPRLTGLQAARELAAAQPELRVLILSMHDNEQYFFEALRAGRVGLRAEVGRPPRPRRGVPRGDARRAVPLPGAVTRADPRLPRARARTASGPTDDPLTPRETRSSS